MSRSPSYVFDEPGLQPGSVSALPECHGCLAVEDVAIFRVAFEHLLCPVGDIAEMTKQRAPMPFLDLAQAEVVAAANRRNEWWCGIHCQPGISSTGVVGTFLDQPIVDIINLVIAEFAQRKSASLSP